MIRKTSRLAIFLVTCIAMPSAYAYEADHAALTTFCPLTSRAHGLCVSKHTGGTAKRIVLECVLIGGYKVTAIFSDIQVGLADNTHFNMPIHGSLYNSATYCTKNLSRYQHNNGKDLNPQGGTAMHCKYYQGEGERL